MSDNPFAGNPPRIVRAMVYQYWFTDLATKRRTGAWWRREELGEFSPSVQRDTVGNRAPTLR